MTVNPDPQNHVSIAPADISPLPPSLPPGVLLHAHLPDDRRVPDPAEGEGGEAEPEEAGHRLERQGGRRRRRGRQLPQRVGDSASADSGGREQSEEGGLKTPAGCYCQTKASQEEMTVKKRRGKGRRTEAKKIMR